MKKYIFICSFLFACTHLALAQLTLKKIEGSRKITLPIGSLIEIKMPTKTSRPDCNCFEAVKGYLKETENDSLTLMLTEISRETFDDSKAGIREKRAFQPANQAIVLHKPIQKKIVAVQVYSERNMGLRNVGAVFFTLSAMSNLLLSPFVGNTFGKTLRNFGYGGMAFGVSTLLLPTKKVYYFEQPQKVKKKKRLWRLMEG